VRGAAGNGGPYRDGDTTSLCNPGSESLVISENTRCHEPLDVESVVASGSGTGSTAPANAPSSACGTFSPDGEKELV